MSLFRRLLAGFRDDSGPVIARAIALRESGDHDQAKRLCDTILADQPDHAAALHCLGVIALTQGRIAEAITRLEHCARSSGADPQVQYDLAEALRLDGRWEAAGEAYARVLALKPDFVAAHLGLADCLLARQQAAAAGEHCTRALQSEPGIRAP